VKRGEVYRVALDPTVGAEKQKTRPYVIVRRDMIDEASEQRNPLTIIVPLNDAGGREGNALNVFVSRGVAGATKDSLVVCSQVRALDKRRFVGKKLGEMPTEIMQAIDNGLRVVLALDGTIERRAQTAKV
jgi:mRNA interferase MazF